MFCSIDWSKVTNLWHQLTKLFNAENVVEQKTQKFIFLSILRKIAIEFWEESFLFLSLQNENEIFYSHYLVAAIVVGTHGLKKATKRLRVGANISFEKSNWNVAIKWWTIQFFIFSRQSPKFVNLFKRTIHPFSHLNLFISDFLLHLSASASTLNI